MREAVLFVAAQSLVGLCVLAALNRTAALVAIASVPLVMLYPFMKRITYWPQAFLGITFNWGALVGYAAATGTLDAAAVLLYAAGFFWTLGYDTIYAHQDKEDDALIGVRSTALLLGDATPRMALGLLRRHPGAAGDGRHPGRQGCPVLPRTARRSPGCCCVRCAACGSATPPTVCSAFRANRDVGLAVLLALVLGTLV